ncbi:hypothetical protein J416_12587 [Gracilibacillus halophilus YIM-C55.5]|uniref:Ribonuclease M5 n=1 Tax=Gracilibacillus halophilus YIM-C55.5 TaxID=1308866 RepID=N4WA40_9BACI|nr:ribonuclease M5 [Gracilibacillus halophilus]ENH96119.1 hypothetical protein J416_12587 [Gracilibacillus halophilus YIM-C55.5]
MKIKEVVVVEGKDDSAKLKQTVDVDTIETNGSAINEDTLEQIKHAQQKRGVIVFTDPDYPGKRIRHIINQHVPRCKHAFLTKQEAIAKRDKGIGIEHASEEAIRNALAQVYQVATEVDHDITREDLIKAGLIGGKGAKPRRDALGKKLRIGYVNGKQLLKRLHMFQISREQLFRAIEEIAQEESR